MICDSFFSCRFVFKAITRFAFTDSIFYLAYYLKNLNRRIRVPMYRNLPRRRFTDRFWRTAGALSIYLSLPILGRSGAIETNPNRQDLPRVSFRTKSISQDAPRLDSETSMFCRKVYGYVAHIRKLKNRARIPSLPAPSLS